MAFGTDSFLVKKGLMRDSQPELLENFTQIDAFMAQDHEALNAANQGKHAQLTCPSYSDIEDFPEAGETEKTLFCANRQIVTPTLSNSRSIDFYTQDSDGIVKEFGHSISRARVASPSSIYEGSTFSSGQMTLPSGILIKWQFFFSTVPSNTVVWETENMKAFTNQYFAIAVQLGPSIYPSFFSTTFSDPNIVHYVTDISDPTRVVVKSYQRDEFTVFIKSRQDPAFTLIAIGD